MKTGVLELLIKIKISQNSQLLTPNLNNQHELRSRGECKRVNEYVVVGWCTVCLRRWGVVSYG